jgi:hypothetical protein
VLKNENVPVVSLSPFGNYLHDEVIFYIYILYYI